MTAVLWIVVGVLAAAVVFLAFALIQWLTRSWALRRASTGAATTLEARPDLSLNTADDAVKVPAES